MGEEQTLEQDVEIGEELAEDFVQPGDEDYNEDLLNETVEETHQRTLKALETGKQDEDQPNSGDENPDQSQAEEPNKPDATLKVEEPSLAAPARFTVEAKEAWKQAPKVLKEQYAKAIQDLEAGQSQKLRQIHEVKTAAESIVRGIEPFAKDWAQRGVTPAQGISLLAATHERMLENPAAEIARLIEDNDITLEDVRNVTEGTPGQPAANFDISQHPQFKSLQERIDSYENERIQSVVKAETDKIKALRDQKDEFGNQPFIDILNPSFLQYAQPLVSALRTPPRGPDGKFLSGPTLSIEEAYKKAYYTWLQETGKWNQANAPRHQPDNGTQAPPKKAEPVSMRSRKQPVGASVVKDTNSADFRHESVEETVARLRQGGWE